MHLLQLAPIQSYRVRTRGVHDVDERTVISILQAAESAGVLCHLTGGWGVDALAGRQTRLHDDLDLAYEAYPGSTATLERALDGLGFKRVAHTEVPNALFPLRILLRDPQCRHVDLLPMLPLAEGSPAELPVDGASVDVPRIANGDLVIGHIGQWPQRVAASCLSPTAQLAARRRHEPRPSDLHDDDVLRRVPNQGETPPARAEPRWPASRQATRRAVRSSVGMLRRRLRPDHEESTLLVAVPEALPVLEICNSALGLRGEPPVPPHVTILHPFVPPSLLTPEIDARLRCVFARQRPIRFRMERIGHFPGVAYLEPEPASEFIELTDALQKEFPDWPPYGGRFAETIPHLTLAEGPEVPPGALRQVEAALPLDGHAREVLLMCRPAHGRWRVQSRYQLGAAPGTTVGPDRAPVSAAAHPPATNPSSPEDLSVIIVPDYHPTSGGTVRQAANLARGMAELGRTVNIVTRRYSWAWPRREVVDGIAVHRFGLPGRWRLGEKLSLPMLALWLRRRRRHVVMVQTIMFPDYAVIARLMGLRTSTIVIWAALGEASDVIGPAPDVGRAIQRWLRRRLLDGCHHVALTPAMRQELTSLGIPGPTVIPVPVDSRGFRVPSPAERAAARERLGLAPGELTVIYTGRFVPAKGLVRLIEAFSRVTGSGFDARLILVGDGDVQAARDDLVRFGVVDRSLLPGLVDDVQRYLWASDVFVLPSLREGLSNSLAEAMSCGLACVATAEAGGDQVLHHGAGVIPPDSSAAALAAALLELAADSQLRRELGRKAAERAQEFGLERVVRSFDALLDLEGEAS